MKYSTLKYITLKYTKKINKNFYKLKSFSYNEIYKEKQRRNKILISQ